MAPRLAWFVPYRHVSTPADAQEAAKRTLLGQIDKYTSMSDDGNRRRWMGLGELPAA